MMSIPRVNLGWGWGVLLLRPGESGAPGLNQLGNRAGAGRQTRRERGIGQLAGASGAPGLVRGPFTVRYVS